MPIKPARHWIVDRYLVSLVALLVAFVVVIVVGLIHLHRVERQCETQGGVYLTREGVCIRAQVVH